jgi:hypothetical protein
LQDELPQGVKQGDVMKTKAGRYGRRQDDKNTNAVVVLLEKRKPSYVICLNN